MSVDPAVINAIETAILADPSNSALRLHLVGLLNEAGRHEDALDHVMRVLADEPDNVAALRAAALAAAAGGNQSRARAYERIAASLADEPPTNPDEGPTVLTSPGTSDSMPDTAEELLSAWHDMPAANEPDVGAISAPQIRLSDVGGMETVKRRLDLSFMAPLRNPGVREQFGSTLRGGLLLWGPPGCGKTYPAKALAGELGASFYEIGLADVLDMWVGSSERNLHSVFEVAREHNPCLLFFDEIDALGHQRSQLRAGGAAMRGVVNQLLVELDGASSRNDGLFVLGATNHPWDVDSALLRPGRFDRSVFVGPPDQAARETIMRIHLRNRPIGDLDLRKIAKMTDGLSGADLALACQDATDRAMRASLDRGEIEPVTQSLLVDAARSTKSSIRPWMETARSYARFSNTAGMYDELEDFLKRRRP